MEHNIAMSGFRVEERPDGIIVYHFSDFRRAATDEWVDTTMAYMQRYDEKGEHLRLLNLIETSVLPTPYGTTKAMQLAASRPQTLAMSLAVNIPNVTIMTGIRFILNRVQNTDYIRMFNDNNNAVEWLDERHQQFESRTLQEG
jgi:hypothetical protein